MKNKNKTARMGFRLGLIGVALSLVSAVWLTGALEDIPDQSVIPGESFVDINLSEYLSSGTSCDTYTITPVFEQGSDSRPTVCAVFKDYSENMTVTLKMAYAGQYFFKHADDYLVAYDEQGRIVACGTPSDDPLDNGDAMVFYLTIAGGNANYNIDFEFYSGASQKQYMLEDAMVYMQDANLGNLVEPIVLDVAPLKLSMESQTKKLCG